MLSTDDRKWDIRSINKRLKQNKAIGMDNIQRFQTNIYESLISSTSNYIENLSNEMIENILSYSNHKQIIDKHIQACNKLDIFGYLMSKPCSMMDIYKFEKTAMKKCNLSHYEIPSYLRVSLMISDMFSFTPEMFPCEEDYYDQTGCMLEPFQKWEWNNHKFVADAIIPFIDNVENIDEDVKAFEKETNDSGQECVVLIGQAIWGANDMFQFVWNILTNKILYNATDDENTNKELKVYESFEEIIPQKITDWKYQIEKIGFKDRDFDNKFFSNVYDLNYDHCSNEEVISDMTNYSDEQDFMVLYDYYLSQMYSRKYEPLINGYIRRAKTLLFSYNIPICINQLILTYFPFFLPA